MWFVIYLAAVVIGNGLAQTMGATGDIIGIAGHVAATYAIWTILDPTKATKAAIDRSYEAATA